MVHRAPNEAARQWVDAVHRHLGDIPHRVTVAYGDPLAVVAEAGAGGLEDPVPLEAPVATDRMERRRTAHAVHLLVRQPGGAVLGLSVPPDKMHPVLGALLGLAGDVHRMLVSQQHQRAELLSLAHEVRNPLMLIAGYAELLGHRGEDEVSALLLEEVRRVDERVEEFLTAGRPTSRALVDVADVVTRVLRRYEAAAATRGVHVVVDAGPVYVVGDAAQLETALANLVKNALEAMSTGGRLELVCARVDRWAEIWVADTGAGVAHDVADRVFQPYVSTKPDGHGLGLSLVADVVERHGGEVALVPSGTGATFRLRLPAAEPPSGGSSTASSHASPAPPAPPATMRSTGQQGGLRGR